MQRTSFKKIILLSLVALTVSFNTLYSQETTPEQEFEALNKNQLEILKPQSRPFIISQGKKSPTAVLIHGLSDSPGSMVEVSKIYEKNGYNVLTVLLRDHGIADQNLRHIARAKVKLADWRKDIDKVMEIAFKMSDSGKIALAGYSLGGALATDTADRYNGKITSLVLMTPLFKMNHGWAAPAARVLKHVKYSIAKGVPEAAHFYPDIALNQTQQAYKLTKYLKKRVTKNAKAELKDLPKIMFLTDADSTIKNDFAIKTAQRIEIPSDNIIIYENLNADKVVLHRDLPMRTININNKTNPHIEDLLMRLDHFLDEIR